MLSGKETILYIRNNHKWRLETSDQVKDSVFQKEKASATIKRLKESAFGPQYAQRVKKF